jgi:Domain of unknown function (DUF4249)
MQAVENDSLGRCRVGVGALHKQVREWSRLFFPVILWLLTGAGCEQIIESPDLPYVEQIVVTGLLEANSREATVTFTRTLPLNGSIVTAQAGLTNVHATIVTGGRVYPLTYAGGIGDYRTSGLYISPGQVYELHAEWNGKRVYASTYVPHPLTEAISSIDPFPIQPGRDVTVRTVFRPRPDEVYTQTWQITRPSGVSEDGGVFGEIARFQDAPVSGMVTITDDYSYFPLSMGDTPYPVIHAFDEQYYAYYKSRVNIDSNHADNIFLFGGAVTWNVKGDGIGLFIGRSISRIKIPT